MQPSSAAAESFFLSLLQNSFGSCQDALLTDYVQVSLMLLSCFSTIKDKLRTFANVFPI